jgi:acyl-CoA thioesterase I
VGATTGQGWVARLQTDVSPRGVLVTNLAVGGTTTYVGLPSSSVPVSGRPLPNGSINIDAALAHSPKLVLVAYPTNDTEQGYSVSETVTNLLAIRTYARARGVAVMVQGTQPRNLTDAQRALLPQIDTQLATAVGPCFVDVRSLLASADGRINPIYDSGDGVHVNNAGHAVIFNRVKAVLDAGTCVRATSP